MNEPIYPLGEVKVRRITGVGLDLDGIHSIEVELDDGSKRVIRSPIVTNTCSPVVNIGRLSTPSMTAELEYQGKKYRGVLYLEEEET